MDNAAQVASVLVILPVLYLHMHGCHKQNGVRQCLQVRWRFHFRQRLWLNVTNQRRCYQDQALTVWEARRHMAPGTEAVLPAPLDSTAQTGLCAPTFGYVLCLRQAAAFTSNVACLAAKLLHNKETDPAACSLQQIYCSLEEGTYDPTALNPTAAHNLVTRVMVAGDDELLLMLVEAGITECCSQTCLQQLMQYAMLESLPYLAEVLVENTKVELSAQVRVFCIDLALL